MPEPTQTAKKQQLVAKPSKPFFSFLFALLSQFTRICRNFHYVFITVQPEKARVKDSKRDARRLQLERSGLGEKGPLMTTSVGTRCRRWPMPIHVGRAGLVVGGVWQFLFSRSLPGGFKPWGVWATSFPHSCKLPISISFASSPLIGPVGLCCAKIPSGSHLTEMLALVFSASLR